MSKDTPPQPARSGIDWTSVNIGVKEFLAGIVFIATLSGVYYRLYYKQSEDRLTIDMQIQALNKRLEELEKKVGNNSENIRRLEDAERDRRTLENAANSIPYTQMKRVR